MRKQLLRGFWPRAGRKKRGAAQQLLLSVVLGVGLALFLIHQFDAALRPQLVALAQAKLRNQLVGISNHVVAEALSQQALSDPDIVLLQPAPGGVSTLSTDTVRLNRLRTAVMEEIVAQVEALDSRSLGIPLGTLTGIDLLSAAGPAIPVRVLSVATVDGGYRNEFISAGINQTLHRVLLDVDVTAQVLMPGGIVETAVSTPVCIAETVVIGQVPQTYLGLNQ